MPHRRQSQPNRSAFLLGAGPVLAYQVAGAKVFHRKLAAVLAATVYLLGVIWAQPSEKPDSFRCAVIGDAGTGGHAQYEIAARMAELRTSFMFESVLMLGDNLYGSENPQDFRTKFELPYAQLLDSGVKFYAVLGNHDHPSQQTYKPFHMDGRRCYSFSPRANVRFFGLDSNRMDQTQLAWLEKELALSGEEWKIAFFHHPLYSSGARHGSSLALRAVLEPLFLKYGVTMALSGHDHFYERTQPQKGVHYFVVGGAGKLRAGNARRSEITVRAFDRDYSFLLIEINEGTLHFRAISRSGETVDKGSIQRPSKSAPH